MTRRSMHCADCGDGLTPANYRDHQCPWITPTVPGEFWEEYRDRMHLAELKWRRNRGEKLCRECEQEWIPAKGPAVCAHCLDGFMNEHEAQEGALNAE